MERENQRDLSELQQFFSQTEALIEEQLFPLAQKYENRAAMEALRQAWLRLKQGPVRVLFLGVSSAGKSTLVNAMIGSVVVPEGKHTTSPVPVWIHSSESAKKTPRIRIIREPDGDELPKVSNAGGFTFITTYCYAPKEAPSDTAREKYKDLIAATVDVQFQSAPNSGLTLIDAPGINASVGDNLRVEDVLHQGCEMVILVFNQMTQSNKDYLRHLLVDDDGLLHPLLESGRVFAVHNYVTPGTKADAKAHLKDLFGEALPHCYMVNALRWRLKAAGVYNYLNFLQDGATDEEEQEAMAGYKNEEKELEKLLKEEKKLKGQKDCPFRPERPNPDKLWADLQERSSQLMDTPEECKALIAPICDSVNQAIRLLDLVYEEEIEQIQGSEQGTDQDKVQQCDTLREQLKKIREAKEYAAKAFDDTDKNSVSSQWRREIQAFFPQTLSFMKSRPELQGYYLICEKNFDTNKVLLEGIEGSSWASSLVHGLLSQRASNMQTAFLNVLQGEEFQKKELSALIQSFQRNILEMDQALGEMAPPLSLRQEILVEPGAHIASLHEEAALLAGQSFHLTLDTETADTLIAYLENKQTRINSRSLRSHISRAFLDVNLEVEHLNPYVRSRLEGSMAQYKEAMGASLEKYIADLRSNVQATLEIKESELEDQITALEEQIKSERETWQENRICEIEEQRRQLQTMKIG